MPIGATPLLPGAPASTAKDLKLTSPTNPPPQVSADMGTMPPSLDAATLTGGSPIEQIMMLVVTVIGAIVAGMAGGSLPQLGATGAGQLATPPGPSPETTLTNTTEDADNKAALDNSLSLIASDPDGAKLLAEAKAKGVTISVGDPASAGGAFDVAVNCPLCQAAADAAARGNTMQADAIRAADSDGGRGAQDDNVVVNGVTLTNSQTGATRIVVRDPNNIKTIVHELVHAVSTEDGNSKQEEGIADVIGSRVANKLGGAAVGGLSGTDEQIFLNKQQFYPDLQDNNRIRDTLRALGLMVSV